MVKTHTFVVLVPTEDGGLVAYTSGQFTETQRRAIEHMTRNIGVTPPTPALCGLVGSVVATVGENVAGSLLMGEYVVATAAKASPAPTKQQKYAAARSQGYTGDPCTTCQSMSVKRNGACLVCESCGSTTGCS